MSASGRRITRARFHRLEARVFTGYELQPAARTLELDELGISLRALELGAGEPLLLLHGLSLSVVHWAPLIARLGWARCIALDMPGHGQSEPVNFTGRDLRKWHTSMLTGCLDRLGLRSAHIVGHSYGGMFGMWLALDAPERVRSVVCIGTPAVALGANPDLTLRALSWPLIGRLLSSAPNPGFVYRQIIAASLGRAAVKAVPKELHQATYLGTRRGGFARTVSTYLREQFTGTRARPPRYALQDHELQRIEAPLLIIWGEHDTRYQPIEAAKRRAELIPAARFELVHGGHEPWLDDLDRCVRLLAEWVECYPRLRQAVTTGEEATLQLDEDARLSGGR